ncbi:MAG TPA: AAA family ATPase [Thermaerobacter sp.]
MGQGIAVDSGGTAAGGFRPATRPAGRRRDAGREGAGSLPVAAAGAPDTARAGVLRTGPGGPATGLGPGWSAAGPECDAGWDEILRYLPPALARRLAALPAATRALVEEIRVAAGRPLWVLMAAGDAFVAEGGRLVGDPHQAPPVGSEELAACLERMTSSSWYAVQEQARQGFLILPGGHRVGLAGEVQVVDGRIERFRVVRGLVIRRARQVPGRAGEVIGRLVERRQGQARLASTLLIGAPGSGKTTLLRELVRLASQGVPGSLPGLRVAVVDERGELAGAGAFDLGPRTEVLEHCPKAAGIILALRALSPQLVATDEIGGPEDAAAVAEAMNAGVSVLATAHAGDPAELARRRHLRPLLRAAAFTRVVRLERRPAPGTCTGIYILQPGGNWAPAGSPPGSS